LYFGVILLVIIAGAAVPYLHTPGWSRYIDNQGWFWLYAINIGQSLHGLGYFYYDWFDFTHFWTLAVEEHYYLLWPWILLCTNRRGFLTFCFLLILGGLAARGWGCVGAAGWPYALTASLRQSNSIVIGSLLALALRGNQSARWTVRLALPTVVVFGAASAALLAIDPHRAHWPRQVFESLTLGLTFAGLVAYIVAQPTPNVLRGLCESRFLRFFGKYSYGLYIFHHLLFPEWLAILNGTHRATGIYRLAVAVMFVVATTTSIGLSMASWRYFESPLLELKKYFVYKAPSVGSEKISNQPQEINA
jgi:peptidoglycan/LPS O-acetylase OafA/YrhL